MPSPAIDARDARLRALAATFAARRPAFGVATEEAAQHLRALVERAPDPEAALQRLHADDALLALACARGSEAALAEFDERILPQALKAVSRAGLPADFADEVAQAVRSRLFAPDKGKPPRIAGYAGRASLETWTRAVALRAAASLHARALPDVRSADERLVELATNDSAELDLLREQVRQQFRACFEAALASLPRRTRAVLRLHVIDGVTLDGLARAYGVHRATVARWLATARADLLKRTRARLATALRLPSEEIDSLIELARSRLDFSLGRLLDRSADARTAAR